MLFTRAVVLGELGAEEMVELAAACEADPWLDKDQDTLAVQRVHHWFMLEHALLGFWAPAYELQDVVGEPMVQGTSLGSCISRPAKATCLFCRDDIACSRA